MSNKVTMSKVLSTPDYKVINVSGKSGDSLEKHKVNNNALLLVKSGCITYKEENGREKILNEGEGQDIPAEVYHELYCNDTSEMFLVIPLRAKIRFKREE